MKTVLAILVTLTGIVSSGCEVEEVKDQQPYSEKRGTDASSHFDEMLKRHIGVNGCVDYAGIRQNPFQLIEFVRFLEAISPESHPDLFQTSNDEKAYWINAYNALIMKSVTDHPEINSVNDILFAKGIFWRAKFILGGRSYTLLHIENSILRKRYKDAQIHFAINCASNSCPPLGNRIFLGDQLDEQLDQKAAQFIQDPTNVRLDQANQEIWVSRLFKWYQRDFGQNSRQLKSYILQYRPDLTESIADKIRNDYKIRYFQYDWGLNDLNEK